MNKYSRFVVASLACLSQAFAGVVYVEPHSKLTEVEPYGANLNDVKIIKFEKPDSQSPYSLVVNPGEEPAYEQTMDNIYRVNFKVNEESEETMTITGKNGHGEYSDVFMLKDVAKIEVVPLDDKDSDKDGISDFDEIYKYETNPNSPDTDGDGFSDYQEIFGMASSDWNPKIANLPILEIEMVGFPELYLKKQTSTNNTQSENITESVNQSENSTVNFSYTHTSTVQSGWSLNINNEWSLSAKDGISSKLAVNRGNSGSLSNANGQTVSNSNQTTMSKGYSKAVSEATTNGETITGAKIRVTAKLTNKSTMTYSIENLSLLLSAYTASEGVKVISEVKHQNDNGSQAAIGTLNSGESMTVVFEDGSVDRSVVEQFIRNPGAIFLTPAVKKITLQASSGNQFSGSTDFSGVYTSVNAQTASVVIDYGPMATGDNSVLSYQVAPNFRKNENSTSADDLYKPSTLREILEILKVTYEVGAGQNGNNGLVSVNGFRYASDKPGSAWYVWLRKAKERDKEVLYSTVIDSYELDDILIDAGDEVHIYYSVDEDGDKIPLHTEILLGTSDKNVDSDGDGLTDYEEIYGWRGPGDVVYHTNPTLKDTDFDGMDDAEDDDPINARLFTSADLDMENMLVNNRPLSIHMNDHYASQVLNGSSVTVTFESVTPVGSIKLVRKGMEDMFLTPKEGSKTSYQVKLDNIKASESNYVDFVVTAQDGEATKTYTLSILSWLGYAKSFELSGNTAHDAVLGDFTVEPDDRIQGYLVLRVNANDIANNEKFMNNMDFNDTREPFIAVPVEGKELDNGIVIAKVLGPKETHFEDKVGKNSPYYTYRVVSYTFENGKYIYSNSFYHETRGSGKIMLTYQFKEVGTKMLGVGPARRDMRISATLMTGKDQSIHRYSYFMHDAGYILQPNTIYWETKTDEQDYFINDDNSIAVDTSVYTVELLTTGIKLELKNEYHDALGDNEDSNSQTLTWTYDAFHEALVNKEENRSPDILPPNGETLTITWGESGHAFDGKDECGPCGDEPHAGVKMKFSYKFVEVP